MRLKPKPKPVRKPVRLVVARKATPPPIRARVAMPMPQPSKMAATLRLVKKTAPAVRGRAIAPGASSRAGARAGAASGGIGPMPNVSDEGQDEQDDELEDDASPDESEGGDESEEGDEPEEGESESEDVGALLTLDGDSGQMLGLAAVGVAAVAAIAIGYTLGKRSKRR